MAFGSKNSTPSFVLTLSMDIGLNEQDLLYKEFNKENEEVVLPDEVKAQMEKEISVATAKVKTSIGKGELHIVYGDYKFPVTLRNPNTQTGWYQQEALKCGVKYCRIVRKWVGTKWKYYAQIVLEGYPPIKCDNNGVAKHPVKLNNNFLGARHSLIKELPRKR